MQCAVDTRRWWWLQCFRTSIRDITYLVHVLQTATLTVRRHCEEAMAVRQFMKWVTTMTRHHSSVGHQRLISLHALLLMSHLALTTHSHLMLQLLLLRKVFILCVLSVKDFYTVHFVSTVDVNSSAFFLLSRFLRKCHFTVITVTVSLIMFFICIKIFSQNIA